MSGDGDVGDVGEYTVVLGPHLSSAERMLVQQELSKQIAKSRQTEQEFPPAKLQNIGRRIDGR